MTANTLMIDIETLGTAAKSVVLAIGAYGKDKLGNEFKHYVRIDTDSQLAKGRKIDASTMKWWMTQNPNAKTIFDEKEDDTYASLTHFFHEIEGSFHMDEMTVFGNGANFDITIIEDLLSDFDVKVPWKFWNIRCYRTIKNMRPQIKMLRQGVHHNALDDAKSQFEHLERLVEGL